MRLISLHKPAAEWGGSGSFIFTFSEEARKLGIPFLFESAPAIERDDVLFVNSWVVPAKVLSKYWKMNVPILLRLDGAARDYGRFDNADQIQGQVAALADGIVFQSEYCRRRLHEKWGIIRKSGRVIYNGVDTALFSPRGDHRNFPGNVRVAYVSHSTNLLKGFRVLLHLARKLANVTFVACTPARQEGWPDEALGAMPAPRNLILLGRMPREELPSVLRGCDIFVSPSVNDSCSSAVVEAMACGLPIWYHPSGGTPELVGSCGVAFSDNPAEDVENLVKNRETLSRLARERAEEHFDIRRVAKQYIDTADELLHVHRQSRFRKTFIRKIMPTPMISRRKCPLPRIRVGYYLPCDRTSYENVPASVWMRCFQMIDPLSKMGIDVVVNPDSDATIDLAVILRLENEHGVEIAKLLKSRSIPYIFDMVANYLDAAPLPYDQSLRVTKEQNQSTIELIEGAALVTAVSPWLSDRASFLHSWTVCIPDAVPDNFFQNRKDEVDFQKETLRACYIGTSAKSKDLLPWLQPLNRNGIELTMVSEKEPPPEFKDKRWEKWSYERFAEQIIRSEIGLAPRTDMNNPYNGGHSSFKIASFMACGVPVIASRVPSYIPLIGDGEAGRVVEDILEFDSALKMLGTDRNLLCRMAAVARERVRPLAVSNVVKSLAQILRQTIAFTEK